MKNIKLMSWLVIVTLCLPCFGQQGGKTEQRSARDQSDNPELFLADDDIAHVKRILPGLADASQQGPTETVANLAKLDISFDRITQILSNMSVAYSAIKFDEWMQEIKPKLDMRKPSAYRQLLEQSQRQLDQITAKYKSATRRGKTALDINKEVVKKNRPDVESLLVRMQGMKASSMPFHP
jgi:hypothetical protein